MTITSSGTNRAATALATVLAAHILPLHAASTPDSSSATAAEDNTLEEVIVTANKREENTKDVPVSIGVVDSQEITALHVQTLEDVTRIVPGVSFAKLKMRALPW